MGFQKEREEKRRKQRKWKILALFLSLILLAGFLIFASIYPPNTWKYSVRLPDIERREAGELRLHFLDVEGECTIVEFPDGKNMIIDGGNGSEDTAKKILRYLNALDIDVIDYMVLTNPLVDHVGSLDGVLQYKKVKRLYCPYLLNRNINIEYAEFCSLLDKKKVEIVYTEVGKGVVEEEYRFLFLAPTGIENPEGIYAKVNSGSYTDEDLKNLSAVLCIEYKGRQVLLLGDCGKEGQRLLQLEDSLGVYRYGEWEDFFLRPDVVKLSDNGNKNAFYWDFFTYILPADGIGMGEMNAAVEDALIELGIRLHASQTMGNIIVKIKKDGSYTIE